MNRLALLCSLAGCFSDEAGLHIVVHDEVGDATSVDMYIVTKDPGVPGMTPKDSPPLTGPVFVLDSAKPPRRGTLVDGKVVFNILPEDPDERVEVVKVAFIGRDAQEQAVSFGYITPRELEVGGSAAYRMDLIEPASPISKPSDVDSPGVYVYEWDGHASATPRAKCTDVAFAEDAIDGDVIHYFFVPPDDFDCDGAMECSERDELVYGVSPVNTTPAPDASLDNTDCAALDDTTSDKMCHLGFNGPNVCMPAGNPVCTAFTAEKFCAPLSVCAQSECFTHPDDCFASPPVAIGVGTYLDCKISADDLGMKCPDFGASSVVVDFGTQLADAFNLGPPTDCVGAQVWRPGHTTDITAMDPLSSTLVQANTAHTSVPFSVIPDAGSGCNFTLAYLGGAQDRDYVTGGIDIQLGMNQHLIIPVRVNFTECSASMQSKCTLEENPDDKHAFKDCLF